MNNRIAIIDLGSNSVRLVITEINADNSYSVINEIKETVRLSEGMNKNKLLQPDAIQRTLRVLRLFKSLCNSSSVNKIIAVATAAVREAVNQKEFLHIVELDTGIVFEVVTGEQEAALGFRAIECTMNIQDGFSMDLGGASTEVIRFKDKKIVDSVSFPFGAVTLTERFLNKGANTRKNIHDLEKYLAAQYKKAAWLKKGKADNVLVGMGGTIRALSKIDRSKKAYSLKMAHGYELSASEVAEIYRDIRFMNLKERIGIPGMPKERADIIIAGCCAVQMLLKTIGAGWLTVSGSGIREGIFYDHYLNEQMQQSIKNVSEFSINNFIKRYNINTAHAERVRSLALELFDKLQELHCLEEEHRALISRAALLHDIGIVIDFYNRDEHIYYLITNSRLAGLSHREIIMTALTAAKFTGNKLKKYCYYHKDIITLEDCCALRKLIILLSICDKLDRSKSNLVEGFHCKITPDKVIMKTIKPSTGGELEIAEANKLRPSFHKVFDKKLEIK